MDRCKNESNKKGVESSRDSAPHQRATVSGTVVIIVIVALFLLCCFFVE